VGTTGRLRRGQRPSTLIGAGTLALHAAEVYDIMGQLEVGENPVLHSEVWPLLTPPAGSDAPETWQKVTASRCFAILLRDGLIERRTHGYRRVRSPRAITFGFSRWMQHAIETSEPLLEGRQPSGEKVTDERGAELFSLAAEAWSLQLAASVGIWLRAIDEQLRRKAEDLDVGRYGLSSSIVKPGRRAAEIADLMARGYFSPEVEKALREAGVEATTGFTEVTTDPRVLVSVMERLSSATGVSPKLRDPEFMAKIKGLDDRVTAPLWREYARWVARTARRRASGRETRVRLMQPLERRDRSGSITGLVVRTARGRRSRRTRTSS
jgi:hypothetical protein